MSDRPPRDEPPGFELESWHQFVCYVESMLDVGRPTQTAYLFRGTPSNKYGLEPSLLRVLRLKDLPVTRAHAIERAALLEFQRLAHLHLGGELLVYDRGVMAWWALMQHHGAPTRLLDWTRSPFVAAYFAVERHPEMPGVIWVVHVDTTRRFMAAALPKAPSKIDDIWELEAFQKASAEPALYFGRNPRETERMAAQQGFFSVSLQVHADHGEILMRSVQNMSDWRERFFAMIVRKELKPEFRRRLRDLNVTARALFPGIDGLGRSVAELVDMEVGSGRQPEEQ